MDTSHCSDGDVFVVDAHRSLKATRKCTFDDTIAISTAPVNSPNQNYYYWFIIMFLWQQEVGGTAQYRHFVCLANVCEKLSTYKIPSRVTWNC